MSTITSNNGLISVDFDTSGLDRFFDQLETQSTDITGTPIGDGFAAAGDIYMEGTRDRFQLLSQSGGSGTWPPLSPKYAARKLKAIGHNAILVYTGELFWSLTPGEPNNIRFPLPDGIVVGTDDPKAAFHQYGTEKMPARPILVDPSDASMAPSTLPDMTAAIGEGFQALIDQCAAGT